MTEVYGYGVSSGYGDFIINAHDTEGVKAQYREEWAGYVEPDSACADLRITCLGSPQSTPRLESVANYRQMDVKAGQRVRVNGGTGAIIDGSPSALFRVLFDLDSPRHPGLVLSCHPQEIELEAPSGAD